jgi:hypothetical protein
MWCGCAALVLLGGLAFHPRETRAQTPGAPVPPAAMTGAGTAVLAGQAIDAVTGQPVANTLLGLSRRRLAGPNTVPSATEVPLVLVMADAQGRFVIREIPEGPYLLLATAPGYIISNHGQGRAAGPTRTIDLAEGEALTDLKIRLWRHPVISGTVTDEAGEPVIGVVVRALRRSANGPGGQRRFMPGPEATTDDRGQYRLTMLPPGQFLVGVPQTQVTVPASVVDTYVQSVAERGGGTAGDRLIDLMNSSSAAPSPAGGVRVDDLLLQSASGGALVTPPAPDPNVSVYPATFYGAGDAMEPEVIAVAPGDERAGIDIRLRPSPAARVSGTVTAAGQAVPNVVVRLIRQGMSALQPDNGFEAAATVTGADGTFTLLGVTPGAYVLKALRLPRPRLPPALAANPAIVATYAADGPPLPGADLVGAQVPITMSATDLVDVSMELRRGATASGRLVFDGAAPPSEADVRRIGVLLVSEDGGLPGANLQLVSVDATGRFEIQAPAPGRYTLTGVRVPAAWRPAGVAVRGAALASAIDLSGDDVTDVTLTYTDRVAGLAGGVQSPDRTTDANPEVVVFPADRRLWAEDPLNPRRPRLEQSFSDGRYRIGDLLPGDYLVAAIETADVPEFIDAAFLEAVARFATPVTLSAGQTVDRSLTVGRVR